MATNSVHNANPSETTGLRTDPGPSPSFDSSTILTQAQALDIRAAWLANEAKSLKLKQVPDVPLVRWIKPQEYGQVLATCMTQSGFPSTSVDGGDGVDFPQVPADQNDSLNVAYYTCAGEYFVHPQFDLPPTAKELGKMYDWLVNVSVPCWVKLGFHPAPPPSRATWIKQEQAFRAGSEVDTWDPYSSMIDTADRAALAKAQGKCPAQPDPSVYLDHVPDLGSTP